MHIKPAANSDHHAITALLSEAKLLTDDLDLQLEHFFVSEIDEQIVAAGGLEIYGTDALLRSLVVRQEIRGKRLGSSLYKTLMQYALSNNVTHVYLLTETAEAFFHSQGFLSIDRTATPASIQQTQQFSSLCPDTATLMIKKI